MKKRITAFIMALVLCLSLLPIGALADGESSNTANGTCGTGLTWTLDAEGVLTISGTEAMRNYSSSSDSGSSVTSAPWKVYRSSIESVVIEDGVTSIGSYAFCGCTDIASVTIGNSVTSIEYAAFSN